MTGDRDERAWDRMRRAAVEEYAARHVELSLVGPAYTELVSGILDDAGINYLSVTGRTKSVTSFAEKAARTHDGVPLYDDPLRQITDQIGVRVITYLHSDVAAVADLLGDQFRVLDDRDLGEENASAGRFGYASRHVLLQLDADSELGGEHPDLVGHRLSVQIRTILQHAWAEFEHDVRYKGDIPLEQAPGMDRRFTLAAGLLELADKEFSRIRDALQAGLGDARTAPADEDPRLSAQELAAFLAGRFPDAGWSRTDHYSWIAGLLLELGITSFDELGAVLAATDSAALNERMGYKYPPGAVRRLDDALLASFGERYLRLHPNAHRTELLRARLGKLRPEGDGPPD